MIPIAGTSRIFVYHEAVNLRKGFEGLSALVQMSFPVILTCGAYFVFLNRRRDRMKILYWDADGLAIWYKRLERGTFSKRAFNKSSIDRRSLLRLLDGVTPKHIQRRYLC